MISLVKLEPDITNDWGSEAFPKHSSNGVRLPVCPIVGVVLAEITIDPETALVTAGVQEPETIA